MIHRSQRFELLRNGDLCLDHIEETGEHQLAMILTVFPLEFLLQISGLPCIEEVQRAVEVLHAHHAGRRSMSGR